MTLQEIKLLFAYNSWATDRVFEALAALPPEPYQKDMKGSHGGIHGTLTHLVGAEKIWLSRWIGKPETKPLDPSEVESLEAAKNLWESVARQTAKFLGTLKDKTLQETFTVITLKGEKYTPTYQQSFQHVVNHSSYHRGQIATMMRQLGFKPSSTDLVAFYRQARGVR